MIAYILSFFLLLNIYSLPMNIEKAADYNKKFEAYEADDDLKKINNRFFHKEFLTFKKLNPGEDLAEAGKGSVIYFAYAGNGTPLAVIKKLPLDDPIDRKELNDEVLSLHEKYFTDAKHFKVPRLIGTAEFSSEDEASAYVIESVAAGDSINSLVKKTATATKSNRYHAFRKLKASVENTAKSFAEMHKIKKYTSYSEYYDNYFEYSKEGAFTGPSGIIHGDAHLGNIFYNTKTGKTTFIDLSFMPRSIDQGAPVGLDSGKFIFTLEAIGAFYGLTDSEIKELSNTYTKTYVASNKGMSEEQIKQYTEVAYKDFAFPDDSYSDDDTSQGDFMYRFAVDKVGKTGKTVFA